MRAGASLQLAVDCEDDALPPDVSADVQPVDKLVRQLAATGGQARPASIGARSARGRKTRAFRRRRVAGVNAVGPGGYSRYTADSDRRPNA